MGAIAGGIVSLFADTIPGRLFVVFVLCLLLAFAIDALSNGRRLYAAAVSGLTFALVGWLGGGYMAPAESIGLFYGGSVLAALALIIDLSIEIVEIPPGESQRAPR